MKIPCGPPRKLTDRQIAQVLNWHQEAIEFRQAHGTVRDLAHVLGVSLHAVRGCFESRISRSANRRIQTSRAPGRPGRPRHLNPAQTAFAIAWREAGRRFRARHGTVAMLARTLGVGTSTIHDCIRRKGRYTQCADVVVCQPTRRGSPSMSDVAVRAALLRAWLRPRY
jgi:transposase